MLLYGSSLIYGFTGTVSFAGIAKASAGGGLGRADLRARVPVRRPVLQGVGGAVPHVDARRLRGRADAGDGLLRVGAEDRRHVGVRARRHHGVPGIVAQWQQIIVFVSVASMALGAFAAIGQTNIKRLMAYSSIGHIGYALIGLAAGNAAGVRGVLVYMSIYLFMTSAPSPASWRCGATARRSRTIADLAGLGAHRARLWRW